MPSTGVTRRRRETAKEAEFRRGPYGHGPRAFAKVVERVTARLQSRLACERGHSAATLLAQTVDKAWRETYAGPLPTKEEVLKHAGAPVQRVTPLIARKRRFVLKTPSAANKKSKQAPISGNDTVSADHGDSTGRRNGNDDETPQGKSRGEAGPGRCVASTGAGARQDFNDEDGRDMTTSVGCGGSADGRTGDDSWVGLSVVSSAATVFVPRKGNDGVSTGEAVVGVSADGDEIQEKTGQDLVGEATSSLAENEADKKGAEEKMSPASCEPDGGPGGKGRANKEVEEDATPPDVIVTANFVDELKKGTTIKRKWWKLELEGGAIEGYGGVLVFDKCLCSFDPPWG